MKTITVRMHTYRVSPDDLTTQPASGPDHADRLTVLYGSGGLRASRRRLPPVGDLFRRSTADGVQLQHPRI